MTSKTNKPIITVIPAAVQRGEGYSDIAAKKRVAAYARVSTDADEQLESYRAQVSYYTEHIQSNPEWEFVHVYTDEAITATNTKNRDGFNAMVADALAGKIDLILTKSVSRFARNTVDSLTTVRKLKAKGVEVYFEKENIYTMDSKGELLITIMSSLAQEESRSISENVTWGRRKRMADGKVVMPYSRFLGYEKGQDGTPAIVETEAEIVRQIYALFLGGESYRSIAEHLTERGIPTPGGKAVWSFFTVRSILSNEKYAGNAILQKHFTVDFLTKKKKINEGEVPQYYVENSHPAIVSPETFDLVQDEIARRMTYGKHLSGSGIFFAKMICGQCGGFYGSKVWHSADKYRRVVWQCNRKYREKTRCTTPHLTPEAIQNAFVRAFALILDEKDRYMDEYTAAISALGDPAAFDEQMARLQMECGEAAALAEDYIAANARAPQDQSGYQKRYDDVMAQYDAAKRKLDALSAAKRQHAAQKEKLRRFVKLLRQTDTPPSGFDEQLWRAAVESITVYSLEDLAVMFKSGTVIHISAKDQH